MTLRRFGGLQNHFNINSIGEAGGAVNEARIENWALTRLSHEVLHDSRFGGELADFSLFPFAVLVFLSGSQSGFALLECLRRTEAFCFATRGGVFGLGGSSTA